MREKERETERERDGWSDVQFRPHRASWSSCQRLESYDDVQVTCLTSLKAFSWLCRTFYFFAFHLLISFHINFLVIIWKTAAVMCVVCDFECFSAFCLSSLIFSSFIPSPICRCLIKDFETRPSVTHLLEHPFIKQAHGKDTSLRQQLSVLICEQQDVGSRTKTRYILPTTQTAGQNNTLPFLKSHRDVHEVEKNTSYHMLRKADR